MRMRSMSRGHREWPNQSEAEIARQSLGKPTNPRSARRALRQGCRSVKITEDVRKYAAEQGIAEEEALKAGLAAKSREFVEAGAEVSQQA